MICETIRLYALNITNFIDNDLLTSIYVPNFLESAGYAYNRVSLEYCHEYCIHRTILFLTHNEI